MGLHSDAPPFPRGTTFEQYADDQNLDTTAGASYEGQEYIFEDKDVKNASPGGGGVIPDRTGNWCICRIVRNKSGGALLPALCAKMNHAGATPAAVVGQVSGYATTVGEKGGVVDEHLPAAGVADNYLFWLVMEGMTQYMTAAAGTTTIAIGGGIIPSTGGKVVAQDPTVAAGAATFNQIQGCFGFCLEAVAAINTKFVGYQRRMGM
jgi:hypothetical protein